MDFGGNFIFINQDYKVKKPKVLMKYQVIGISSRGCVARNFRGGAIGD